MNKIASGTKTKEGQCLDHLATKAQYYRSYNYDVMILQFWH